MNVICYLLLGNFSVETCLLLTKCFGIKVILTNVHSVKSVRIRSFSGPYFPTFRLNMERYEYLTVFNTNTGKSGPEKLQVRTRFTQ